MNKNRRTKSTTQSLIQPLSNDQILHLHTSSLLLNRSSSLNRPAQFHLLFLPGYSRQIHYRAERQLNLRRFIRNAQEAGFRAAIIYDDKLNNNLISMMGNHEGLWIYAVFVSNTAGETLRKNARGVGGECCIISLVDETAWTVLVISFISVLAVICLLVSICFSVNQWRNHQEMRTTAVDDNVVDMLPRITFGSVNLSAPIGETCTICLEDYKHGESLKILPCRHGFHSSCVDSWLTKCATFCPVCKHDVRTRMASSVK
ncbi:RING-type E3 ubiquitin transferase [Salvia divinorum]|uniref:RING-type E3 ubiquitin transferase n=1 Tax=Salvia divinorum TaxID=28513 RepID=A0ABD1I221_SALDI